MILAATIIWIKSPVSCTWAVGPIARRKFVKVAAVRKKHRAKRINPKSLAEQALDYIGKLYGIEKQARRQELDADQIRRLRPGNNLVENAIRPFVVGRTGYLPAAPMGPRPVPPS
jgi:hypothetical protein